MGCRGDAELNANKPAAADRNFPTIAIILEREKLAIRA